MDSLYEKIRDQKIASGIAELKAKTEAAPVAASKVVDIARTMSDLDSLIGLHRQAADLIAAHVSRLTGPNL